MTIVHAVAVNGDDVVAFRIVEQLERALDGSARRPRERLHRRILDARSGQQHLTGVRAEIRHPDPDKVSENLREIWLTAS